MAKAKQVIKVAAPAAEVKPEIIVKLFSHDARRIHDALMCCISKEETRYYLNGVCLDNTAEGLIAVSTDGHRLGRLVLKPVEKVVDEKGREVWKAIEKPMDAFCVIAPTRFIKRLGSLPEAGMCNDICTFTIKDGWIHYKDSNEGFSAKLIDGNFPEWRRVYPKDTAEQAPNVAFNSRYLAQLSSALRKVNGKSSAVAIKIKDNTAPVILHSNKEVADLSYALMPMRF
jgi:DNA polymerase III sliding clamp (beta) subunit (PCNA family)